MRIAVLGYVVRGPFGGLAWHHLQYVLGLSALGHEVLFVEDSDDYASCTHPDGPPTKDPEPGLRFARAAFRAVGLGDRWAYHDAHTATWRGPAARIASAWCRSADVVLNISGVNPLRDWTLGAGARVLIDTDPAFTQIRHLTYPAARAFAEAHTDFFTFAEAIADADCLVPDDRLPWRPTRQPVTLEAWVHPGDARAPFTTVMQWDAYEPVEYAGRRYGMKSESFGAFADLPDRTSQALEVAVGRRPSPVERLSRAGWRVADALSVARTPASYRRYLQGSKGEFAVAKAGYVVSRSGWFSERTAAYLACGRPAVVQDTGMGDRLPLGNGLLVFSTVEEAAHALDAVDRDYARHCRAARAVAQECFDARAVLAALLARVEGTGTTAAAW